MKRYPPERARIAPQLIAVLRAEIRGIAFKANPQRPELADGCWLQAHDGRLLGVIGDTVHVASKFDAWPLEVFDWDARQSELRARAEPPPPDLALDEFIANMRPEWQAWLMSRGKGPEVFEPWPFQTWGSEILSTVEWNTSMESLQAAGVDPSRPPAVLPGQEPDWLDESCVLDSGLLFSGACGGRLLIATDAWGTLLISREAAEIDQHLERCARRPLEA